MAIKICQTVAKPYETLQKYLSNNFEKARPEESAVPIVERLKGIAFLVDHSSLLVPSHCGQYFGKRIESDKIGDGEINLAQLGQRFLCFISGS